MERVWDEAKLSVIMRCPHKAVVLGHIACSFNIHL